DDGQPQILAVPAQPAEHARAEQAIDNLVGGRIEAEDPAAPEVGVPQPAPIPGQPGRPGSRGWPFLYDLQPCHGRRLKECSGRRPRPRPASRALVARTSPASTTGPHRTAPLPAGGEPR